MSSQKCKIYAAYAHCIERGDFVFFWLRKPIHFFLAIRRGGSGVSPAGRGWLILFIFVHLVEMSSRECKVSAAYAHCPEKGFGLAFGKQSIFPPAHSSGWVRGFTRGPPPPDLFAGVGRPHRWRRPMLPSEVRAPIFLRSVRGESWSGRFLSVLCFFLLRCPFS